MSFRDSLISPTGDAGNGGTVISRELEVGYGDGAEGLGAPAVSWEK